MIQPKNLNTFIFIVHNTNTITRNIELDLCGDETTWTTISFGEQGVGMVGRIVDKPGVSEGGQTVLLLDVHQICPCVYLHTHRVHEKPARWTHVG